MGWFTAKVETGYQNQNQNTSQNTYGTRTPNVGAQGDAAYKNLLGNVGTNGATAAQTGSMNFFSGQMNPATNPVNQATTAANTNLDASRGWLGDQSTKYGAFETQPARQSSAFMANAAGSDGVSAGAAGSAGGYTGANFANQYAGLFGSQVTDPALAAYDYGTARDVNALDARTAAAGGFANSRSSEIPYSDLIAQANLGRANLSAQLNQQGLNSAIGYGSQDASRLTSNNQFNTGQANQMAQFNAGQAQQNNQFNASNQTQNNQFNAGQNQNASQFNVNAGYQGDQQNLQAIKARADTIMQHAGLSQQQLGNIVTANGINTSAAQALFEQGAITQAQLGAILDAAGQYNGYSYTEDRTGRSNTNTTSVNSSVGF